MPEQFVSPVEAAGVSAQKPFYAGDQIRRRRLDHPMKMIRPEDVGVQLPAGLGARLAQRLDEALPIRLVLEDRLAVVAAIHDAVDRTGILDSHLARHDARVTRAALVVNIKTPLGPL
jgi:hypothetical protein